MLTYACQYSAQVGCDMERLVILTITDMVISCEISVLIAPPQQHAESCAAGGGVGGGGAEDAAEVQENVITRQQVQENAIGAGECAPKHSVYLLYQYKSTNTVGSVGAGQTDGRKRGAGECVRAGERQKYCLVRKGGAPHNKGVCES
jgi:hypothetical protein